jgi:predicted DNA-binding protein
MKERVPVRVTLDIPDKIHARLKALAKEEGTTMRAIILEAIDCVLRSKKETEEGKAKPELNRR